jgi:hypothetical protein
MAAAAWKRASYQPQGAPLERDRVRLRLGLGCSVTEAVAASRGRVDCQTCPIAVPVSAQTPRWRPADPADRKASYQASGA